MTNLAAGLPAVLAQLAVSAARALALGGAAALGLAAFRVKGTHLRLLVWTTVLYAALAMPFLGWWIPGLEIPAPRFLHYEPAQPQATVAIPAENKISIVSTASNPASRPRTHHVSVTSFPGKPALATSRQTSPVIVPAIPAASSFDWLGLAAAIYFAIAFALLARFLVGMQFAQALVRRSREISDPRLRTIALHANEFRATPRILESLFISVPVTVGALHSVILLPSNWRGWNEAKLRAVIAHEISHVVRRDALTQRLSLLHRAIFWFSPLAWWMDRHLADLAEQASDEAVLSAGADRTDYARTLLGFFEALHAAPGRVWWQGVSMAKSGQAEQRLERILSWRGAVTMSLKRSFVVATIALAIPVVYLAASVRPATPTAAQIRSGQDQVPPPSPAAATAPASPTADVPPPTPAPDAVPQPVAPEAAPRFAYSDSLPAPAAAIAGAPMKAGHMFIRPVAVLAPPARVADVAPVAALAQSHGSGSSSNGKSFYSYGDDDEQRFVIVSGKDDSVTMSGSSEDVRHAQKLKKQIPGDFIWFERDEKTYVIRDQATIDRARKFWAPQEELGRKQEELGKQQEVLGKQQEALGEKMEQVRVKIPDMTRELDALKAKIQKLGSSATMDQIGDLQSEIGELQSKIGEIQSSAGEQQSKLGEEQGALGEQQGKLGEEQGKLGEQQGELAREASKKMKELLDEAITKGTAQPEI